MFQDRALWAGAWVHDEAVFFVIAAQFAEIHVDVGNPLADAFSAVAVAAVAAFPNDHLGGRVELFGIDELLEPERHGIDRVFLAVEAGVAAAPHEPPDAPIAPIIEAVFPIEDGNALPPVGFFLGDADEEGRDDPVFLEDVRQHVFDGVAIDQALDLGAVFAFFRLIEELEENVIVGVVLDLAAELAREFRLTQRFGRESGDSRGTDGRCFLVGEVMKERGGRHAKTDAADEAGVDGALRSEVVETREQAFQAADQATHPDFEPAEKEEAAHPERRRRSARVGKKHGVELLPLATKRR